MRFSRHTLTASRSAAVGLALVLMGACSSNPTPTPTRVEQASPTPAVSSEPSATATPGVEGVPASTDLIRAAVREGTIDEATGLLYRLYAQVFDPRLPAAYQGDAAEDHAVAEAAEAAWDSLTADERTALLPYLVRPTDPASIFRETDATASRGNQLALVTVDPRCGSNGFHRADVPSIPVTVWGRCLTDGAGNVSYTLEAQVAELVGFMTNLWPRMTGLMDTPIGDRFKNHPQRGPNEPEEAGDDRIDIYVVISNNTPYPRNLSNSNLAVTRSVPPRANGTSSAFIVYDPSKGRDTADRKANIAHEFFHVLQSRYNANGSFGCPYPTPAPTSSNSCTSADWDHHWFSDATATWAEHYFVKEARDPYVYDRFTGFLTSALSLSDSAGTNPYRSFVWPYFMQQESPRGADVIADTWKALERRVGWAQFQEVVDHFLPFDSHFRDFAVRVWNEVLEPGNPIDPRFREDPLDPNFPETMPGDSDKLSATPRYRDAVTLDPARGRRTFTEDLPELWAGYYDISFAPGTRRVVFDFGQLAPNASLDVDVLVRVRDRGWERRQLGAGEVQWCLDTPADAIEQAILVLSNHEIDPNKHVTGDWTADPDDNGCATATDTLTYTSFYESGSPDVQGVYQSLHESMLVRVSLAPTAGGNANYLPFGNDQSSYHASYEAHTVLTTDILTCASETIGADAGAFPDDDSGTGINGAMYQGDDGKWRMIVAASVGIEATTVSGPCGDSGPALVYVQLPSCEGTEIADSDPARVFDFRCEYTGPGLTWSVIGKITVAFDPL